MYVLHFQESSVTSKDEVNVNPLTPEEIRHAVQRYTMVGGPFADFMVSFSTIVSSCMSSLLCMSVLGGI